MNRLAQAEWRCSYSSQVAGVVKNPFSDSWPPACQIAVAPWSPTSNLGISPCSLKLYMRRLSYWLQLADHFRFLEVIHFASLPEMLEKAAVSDYER